jgi:hypothetical protein
MDIASMLLTGIHMTYAKLIPLEGKKDKERLKDPATTPFKLGLSPFSLGGGQIVVIFNAQLFLSNGIYMTYTKLII